MSLFRRGGALSERDVLSGSGASLPPAPQPVPPRPSAQLPAAKRPARDDSTAQASGRHLPIVISSSEEESEDAAPAARPRGFGRAFSDQMTFALPPRQGRVAQSASSRNDIRNACAESLRSRQQMKCVEQAEEERGAFQVKAEGSRGRMLGAKHVAQARALVNAKVQTSTYREVDAWGCEEDGEEGGEEDDEVDVLGRQIGRGSASGAAAGARASAEPKQPGLMQSFTYDPPARGEGLLNWRIMMTYKNLRGTAYEWHDAFIFDTRQKQRADGAIIFEYRAFVPVDGQFDGFDETDVPADDICFMKRNSKKGPTVPRDSPEYRSAVAAAAEEE
jgi:hypothetical protein